MNKVRWVRVIFAVTVLVSGLLVGVRGIGALPPVGPFLDPVNGIWAVARTARSPAVLSAAIAALDSEVQVVYDRRGVPHIWASSIEDATRALGFVVARDRLFQLEIQTRATAGRLSEWAGPQALRLDRQQRRAGLVWGAEREMAQLERGSREMRLIEAYAQGINAWIDGMGRKDVPFEFRLLGATPIPWEPVHTLYLVGRMGYTLTYSTHDLARRSLESRFGKDVTRALFPVHSPIQEPIEPSGEDAPRFDFQSLPAPGTPVRQRADFMVARSEHSAATGSSLEPPAVGSNNWAVAPSRTANGYALLAGDPHLELTLPSIWYEVHIVVPGELDIYGVTIPGIPAVVIGFNRHVAWSFTNTGADVLDYFREVVDDADRPAQYFVDGGWRALERRIEEYRGRDGDILAVDTLYLTHRGPLVWVDGEPHSMRWTVLDNQGLTPALLEAGLATSVNEWLDAMASYHAPAQNGVVADRNGNIAIRSTGRFPIRADDGDGTVIRDGTSTAHDWHGYWPLDRYPFALNPTQGFVASANQQPTDPRADPAYLGVNWPTPWRAMRINALLRADSFVTPDAMRQFQVDPGNAKAELFVPVFLEAAERVLARRSDSALAEAMRLLREWDRKYTIDNERAILFEVAMHELAARTWDELSWSNGTEQETLRPTQAVLAELMSFPNNLWWDDRRTSERVEDRDDILAASLTAALALAREERGPPAAGGWRWDEVQQANIWHLLGLSALSALELPVQGGPGTLNPSSGSGRHGASWRMVVELRPQVRAWVTYPGGQSGNPASHLYDDRIPQWVAGELSEAHFPRTPADLPEDAVLSTLILRSDEAKR